MGCVGFGFGGFGFVGMDLAVVAVVVLLDFRWWWLLCCGFDVVAEFDEKELHLI